MTMDWAHATPLASTVGGVMIGASASALLWLVGRIAGISGILGGLLEPGGRMWRLAFILGLMAAPLLYRFAAPLPAMIVATPVPLLVLAGLLVGFGTRMGGGCTSGHGVCGLARLSPRSLAAVVTFMAVGFVTTFVLRHVVMS